MSQDQSKVGCSTHTAPSTHDALLTLAFSSLAFCFATAFSSFSTLPFSMYLVYFCFRFSQPASFAAIGSCRGDAGIREY